MGTKIMAKYMFSFSVVPTDNSWWTTYNNEVVKVSADDLNTAKQLFLIELEGRYGMAVSKSAAKKPQKMYRDLENGGYQQIGLVYKGSTEVDFDTKWVRKYADIWTTIEVLSNPYEC